MVSNSDTAAAGETMATSVSQRGALPAWRLDPTLSSDKPAFVGLCNLESLGLPPEMVHTIQGARASFTTASYTASGLLFSAGA